MNTEENVNWNRDRIARKQGYPIQNLDHKPNFVPRADYDAAHGSGRLLIDPKMPIGKYTPLLTSSRVLDGLDVPILFVWAGSETQELLATDRYRVLVVQGVQSAHYWARRADDGTVVVREGQHASYMVLAHRPILDKITGEPLFAAVEFKPKRPLSDKNTGTYRKRVMNKWRNQQRRHRQIATEVVAFLASGVYLRAITELDTFAGVSVKRYYPGQESGDSNWAYRGIPHHEMKLHPDLSKL